jgi:hypothetical protein
MRLTQDEWRLPRDPRMALLKSSPKHCVSEVSGYRQRCDYRMGARTSCANAAGILARLRASRARRHAYARLRAAHPHPGQTSLAFVNPPDGGPKCVHPFATRHPPCGGMPRKLVETSRESCGEAVRLASSGRLCDDIDLLEHSEERASLMSTSSICGAKCFQFAGDLVYARITALTVRLPRRRAMCRISPPLG